MSSPLLRPVAKKLHPDQPVTLVLAEDKAEAYGIIKLQGLKNDDCAIIENPDFLDQIKLKQGETIYISANASNEMLDAVRQAVLRDVESGGRVKLNMVMVTYS